MINIIEMLNTYNDTWKLTFYFVFGIALLIGLLWTLYKVFRKEDLIKNKLKENIIYNKPYDAIEESEYIPHKKGKKDDENYYGADNYYEVYEKEFIKQEYEEKLKTEEIEESRESTNDTDLDNNIVNHPKSNKSKKNNKRKTS